MEVKYITKTELKSRGWSEGMIVRFAPIPDSEIKNRRYPGGPTIKLYAVEIIEKIEKKEDFILITKKRGLLSNSALKRVKKQKDKLTDYIKNIEIEIPLLNMNELKKRAIYNYNSFNTATISFKNFDSNEEYTKFVSRISVNFLRHSCDRYDLEIDHLFGKVGKKESYLLLKNRILDLISEKYPELKEECNNQIEKLK